MEFGRAEESKRDGGVRVVVIDQVAYKLPVEISFAVNRTEQRACCVTCIVEVPKRCAKVERARACKVDIAHEGVPKLRRLDPEARDATCIVRLIQSPSVREASNEVGDFGLRETEGNPGLRQSRSVAPRKSQKAKHIAALKAERSRVPANKIAKENVTSRDLP